MIQLALLALFELWFSIVVPMRAVEPSDYIYGGMTLVAAVLIASYAGRIAAIILRSKNQSWGLASHVWLVMLPIRIVLSRNRVVPKSEFAATPRYKPEESEFANWLRMMEITARAE